MSSESELRYGKVAHRRGQREASSGPALPTGAPPAPPGHLMPCVRGTRVTTLSPHGRCGAAGSTFCVAWSGEGTKAILNLSPDQELGEKNHNSVSSPRRVSFAASDFTSPVDTPRSQWLRPLGGMRTARGPRSGLALGRGGAVPRWAPPGSGCGEGGGKICASRPEPRVPPSWAESLPCTVRLVPARAEGGGGGGGGLAGSKYSVPGGDERCEHRAFCPHPDTLRQG